MLPAPLLQQPIPVRELVPEPQAGLQVLHSLCEFALAHPDLEVLSASLAFLPLILDLIEAVILGGESEASELLAQFLLREVLDRRLPEPHALLLLRELGCILSLFHSFLEALLRLLLLLLGLRRRPPRRRRPPPAGAAVLVLVAFAPDVGNSPLLFLLEGQLLHFGLVLLRRLAHDHQRRPPEVRRVEVVEELPAGPRQEVVPDLHDHVVALQHGRHGHDHLADGVVVELADAELHDGLVVAVPGGASLPEEAALEAPVEDRPAAELDVVGVPLQEVVQPIERALIRQTHREDDLATVTGRLWDGHHHILSCGLLQCQALEGQWRHDTRPEVHMQRHVLVVHRGVQDLPLEPLGDGHRLPDAGPVAEEAHGVGVGAARLQVEEHGHVLVAPETRGGLRALLVREEEALGVEAHAAVAPVAQDQGGARHGEADTHKLPRHRHPAAASVVAALHGCQGLNDLHLVVVSA
mmetsp:Transcript_66037/g.193258  ORF Transcript_66037/g.193258 Transcript_66037/m.193258 type:complete len:467 (-) Transcript_66037:374-1774(-)